MRLQFSKVHSMKDEPSKKMVTFSNFCLRANMPALPQKHTMASGDDATQKLELAPGTEGSHQLGVSSSRPGRGTVNSMSRSSFAVPSLFSVNRDHPQGRFRFQ